MLRRITHIGTARQHGNGQTARLQRTAMRRTVVAERHTADGYHARSGKRCADLIGDFQTIRRRLARADDGYGGTLSKSGQRPRTYSTVGGSGIARRRSG